MRSIVTSGPAFERYAAECLRRTGHTLGCIIVEETGPYVAVDADVYADLLAPRERYNLYFNQGDDAYEECEAIDEHGLEVWLDVMHGATEYFLPHHSERYSGATH